MDTSKVSAFRQSKNKNIYNPDFKVVEFEHFKKYAGLLTFTPRVSEWVEQTDANIMYGR